MSLYIKTFDEIFLGFGGRCILYIVKVGLDKTLVIISLGPRFPEMGVDTVTS